MADITEQARWETKIYELGINDDIIGGPNGVDNRPHKQLANRTAWLKTQIVPVGNLIIWPTATLPSGYLECDGSALSRATYEELFAVLGTTYNKTGDAADKFRVPDLRGEFIRGWDNGRNVDKARAIGAYQAGTKITGEDGSSAAHNHTINDIDKVFGDPIYEQTFDMTIQWVNNPSLITKSLNSTSPSFWRTVRPRNVAMMYAIKY